MTNKTKPSRRRLLKTIAAAGGAITAAKALPENWTKPVVDSVLLPVHAQATGVTYSIECSVENLAEPICGPSGIGFIVSGSVSASDGSSLVGVSLNVAYTNELGGGGTHTAEIQTGVQAGNVFGVGFNASPPAGEGWDDAAGTIVVTFVDQATYGTASCTEEYDCNPED